jgi:hypothetical protein
VYTRTNAPTRYSADAPGRPVWQPSVRLVVLHVVDTGDAIVTETFPVLGMESGPDGHQPLITLDNGVWSLPEAQRCYLDGLVRLIEAGWPPAEDEARLAPEAKRLEERLRMTRQANGAPRRTS